MSRIIFRAASQVNSDFDSRKLITGNRIEIESFLWKSNSRALDSLCMPAFLLLASLYATKRKVMFKK